MEQALLELSEASAIELPRIVVVVPVPGREEPLELTNLQVPHRVSDAVIRDSQTADGVPFSKTEFARQWRTPLDLVGAWRALLEQVPTDLVFGLWDSHTDRKTGQLKVQRVGESEIVGLAPQRTVKTGSRIDPLGLPGFALVAVDGEKSTSQGSWRINADKVVEESDAGVSDSKSKVPKKTSDVGHTNVPPSADDTVGGVSVVSIERNSFLSGAALRRYRFGSEQETLAGRGLLAALWLAADRGAFGSGALDLRSGCALRGIEETCELKMGFADPVALPRLTVEDAVRLVVEAQQAAVAAGIALAGPLELHADEKFSEYVDVALAE